MAQRIHKKKGQPQPINLGLHAYSLQLATGFRDYKPVGRGLLTVAQLLDKASQWNFSAVQLARLHLPTVDDTAERMVALVTIREQAERLGLMLHLSTNLLNGEHLEDMIRTAHTLGAVQVTVGLSHLAGNVKQRQQRLETILHDLDVAIRRAERYEIMLVLENGRHTAAADLLALIQAAQSDWIGVCFDMGNAMTVPESPVEAAQMLLPHCKSVHLKDMKVYRTVDGVMLKNCPLGEGAVPLTEVLHVLNEKPTTPIFLQTAAERIAVPVLTDEFLQQYPRISARALAGLLRQGQYSCEPEELLYPHELKASERDVLKWEEEQLQQSLKQASLLMGRKSLTLSLE